MLLLVIGVLQTELQYQQPPPQDQQRIVSFHNETNKAQSKGDNVFENFMMPMILILSIDSIIA